MGQRLRTALLAVAAGMAAGVAAAVFLHLLNWATITRDENREIIWLLPVAGLLIGWVYHVYGKEASAGHNLILDEIHKAKKTVPLRMAPLILCGTVVTHLCGGSAGREGTAVQMGGALAERIARLAKTGGEGRRRLLMAGLGAGLSAAIGAPFAGAIFGLEVVNGGKLDRSAWAEVLLASFAAYFTALLLRAPHSQFPGVPFAEFNFYFLFWITLAGFAFGLTARIFVLATHALETGARRLIRYPPLIPFMGGVVLVILFYLDGTYRYNGLGIPYIQEALLNPSAWFEPLNKAGFTALTLGTGFKGGEFVPLVYIGTTLGSGLGRLLPVPSSLLAAMGFGAVFGAAANAPLACTVMIMEIFGWRLGIYGLAACYAAYLVSGPHGIYRAQKKPAWKI